MSNPNPNQNQNFQGARRIPTADEKAAAFMQRLEQIVAIAPIFPISEIYIAPQAATEPIEMFNERRMAQIASTQALFAVNYAIIVDSQLISAVRKRFAATPNAQA